MASVAEACAAAARLLESVKHDGGGLLILTGAGMSVKSGVPVFRGADGSMSPEFLKFLGDYNAARRAAGLREASDWFGFSRHYDGYRFGRDECRTRPIDGSNARVAVRGSSEHSRYRDRIGD